jgi:hypothetical protein
MIRIGYIMGAARCGSTVLDCILGNHGQIESVGELCNLPRSAWLNGEYCACGQPGNVCPFWQAVRREWIERTGRDDVEGYVARQRRYDRFLAMPRLLRERNRPSAEFRRYARETRAVFEAIRSTSGKPIIVTSSKGPARALALSMIPGLDVRLIHLVRDARGMACSIAKAYEKDPAAGIQHHFASRPVWQTAWYWVLYNVESEIIRGMLPPTRSIRLRYEDMTADPSEGLRRIGELLEVDMAPLAKRLGAGDDFTFGHTVAGNRVRMSGRIQLRNDQQWRDSLSARQKRVVRCVAGLLMSRYGYSRS